MKTFSACWSDELGAAIKAAVTTPYTMELTKSDAELVKAAINQGIDSRLEACFIPARGDSYEWDGRRLNCRVSAESLPILVRRLLENGDEGGLASSICSTLDIELI